jgi:hypothetical protein
MWTNDLNGHFRREKPLSSLDEEERLHPWEEDHWLQRHTGETPKRVNIEYLRQAIHSMDSVPDGMSIVEYGDPLRQADETSA